MKPKKAKPAKKARSAGRDSGSPQAMMETFLSALRENDAPAAKLCLSEASLEGGEVNFPGAGEGHAFDYTLKDPKPVDGGVAVEVGFDPPLPGTPPVMEFVLVQENGWKIDIPKTLALVFGADPAELVGQLASAMGDAMKQAGDALAAGMCEAFGAADQAGTEGGAAQAQEDEGPYSDEFTSIHAGAMREIEERLDALYRHLCDAADTELAVRVAWRSFLEGRGQDEARRAAQCIGSDILQNLGYVIVEVARKVPLANRVKRLRIVHAGSPSDRAVYADGSTVIFRAHAHSDGGWYGVDELVQILCGVVAGIPEYRGDDSPISPEPPPGASGWEILDDYRSRFEGHLARRLRGEIGAGIRAQVDWYLPQGQLGGDAGPVRGLYYWGLHRIVGGFALLASDEKAAEILKREALGFALRFVERPEERKVRFSQGFLDVAVCLAAGERGCFYEYEIAKALEDGLEIRLRPLAEGVTDHFRSRAGWIAEITGSQLGFQWDKPGFTSHPDPGRNLFALTLLEEHGVDALCIAVYWLCEQNPNFKQQFARRVDTLRVLHSQTPDGKGVRSDGSAVEYHCYLHEGYDGYLTIKEIQKLLPGIVAGMEDLPPSDAPGQETRPGVQDAPEDQASRAFELVMDGLKPALDSFAQTFAATVGKPMALEVDWDSLGGDPSSVGQLLNACLGGVLGAFAQLGADPAKAEDIRARVDSVVLSRAASRRQARIFLDGGDLFVVAVADQSEAPLDPARTAAAIWELVKPSFSPFGR